MSVLNDLAAALEALAASDDVPMEGVYYGLCPERQLDTWNYFVFMREDTSKTSNRRDWQTRYRVAIVHENYIPEGYVETVKDAVEAAGLRWLSDTVSYDYTLKGSTGVVVELATLSFVKPEKRAG